MLKTPHLQSPVAGRGRQEKLRLQLAMGHVSADVVAQWLWHTILALQYWKLAYASVWLYEREH